MRKLKIMSKLYGILDNSKMKTELLAERKVIDDKLALRWFLTEIDDFIALQPDKMLITVPGRYLSFFFLGEDEEDEEVDFREVYEEVYDEDDDCHVCVNKVIEKIDNHDDDSINCNCGMCIEIVKRKFTPKFEEIIEKLKEINVYISKIIYDSGDCSNCNSWRIVIYGKD